MDDELVRVVTTMARTMEVLVRELQHLREDVNRLHVEMARTSDLRDAEQRILGGVRPNTVEVVSVPVPVPAIEPAPGERWRRFTHAARELGNGVLDDVRSRRVNRV